MNLRKKTTRQEFFSDYVRMLNGILRLSNREAEVFSLLLAVDDYGAYDNINTTEIRSAIVKYLGISEPNLSKYLNTLKNKKLIVRSSTGWVINDYIRPTRGDNALVELTITLEIKDPYENTTTPPDFLEQNSGLEN